jgi:serine/threonine-protein kinase
MLEGPERLLGSRVLEFELSSVVGSGGMAVVYRARHRVTHQEVAIKILPPELAIHDELKARFVEEARVLARLEHPNIVSLNNFVENNGRLCLIMQFVDGKTFEQQIVAAGKLPWADVVRVGVEVCKALEYAHGQQVIHRDIKPSNVLIRADGATKVTDFGIARILGNSRLTSTGQTMGTVRYMSPEQVRGRAVDARSDIYSLGVTLWEGLTGHTPFEGDNQFDIMQQHLSTRPPPLSKWKVEVPGGLEKLLLVAMSKDVRERFQTAIEMRQALEAELQKGAVAHTESASSSKRVPSKLLPLALGGVVAVGAGVAIIFSRKPPPPVATTKKIDAPKPQPKNEWFAPLALPGVSLASDETYKDDRLRVQSVKARAPAALAELRDRYRLVREKLEKFMADCEIEAVRKEASQPAPPLTITLVPQAVLQNPALWPGTQVKPDVDYPSRYMPRDRTLFLADAAGFADELPYGIAMHRFANILPLTNEAVLSLAEKFEAYYKQKPAQ